MKTSSIAGAIAALLVYTSVFADQITTRIELDAILSGSEEYLEDFEHVSFHSGTLMALPNPFNDVTGAPIWADLLPGVTYSSSGNLSMYAGYLWGDDSNILIGVGDIVIMFDEPQVAVGLDLDGGSSLRHYAITLLYGSTPVDTFILDVPSGTTQFFGWQYTAGFTAVQIEASQDTGTSVCEVDNVAWGIEAVVCAADIAGDGASNQPDGQVNVFDLLKLLENWGTDLAGAEIAPMTNVADLFDLLDLIDTWGACD